MQCYQQGQFSFSSDLSPMLSTLCFKTSAVTSFIPSIVKTKQIETGRMTSTFVLFHRNVSRGFHLNIGNGSYCQILMDETCKIRKIIIMSP